MSNPLFERPIVNSPYEYPHRHWELDESGQPTGHLIEHRRRAEFIAVKVINHLGDEVVKVFRVE
jgi:hypothetical protein